MGLWLVELLDDWFSKYVPMAKSRKRDNRHQISVFRFR